MKRKKLTMSLLSLSVALTSAAGSITPALAKSEAQPASETVQVQADSTIDYSMYGDGVNLALNKTAVASSIEANSVRAELAVDGNPSTHWGSGTTGGPDWIYVDLGSVEEVGLVHILWESQKANSYKVQYAVELPADESGWTSIKDSSTWPASIDDNIVLESPVQARYIRVLIPSYSSSDHGDNGIVDWNSISIHEIEVYGALDPNGQNSQTNVALHKTAVASSIEANSVRAELAVDGDSTSHNSRWGSNVGNGPDWIYVDLGNTLKVRTVKLFWENRKATSYSIQIAQEGADLSSSDAWQTVYESGRPETVNEKIELDETYKARYVRLYIPGHSSEDPDGGTAWNTVSIYEMEVYGGILKAVQTPEEALQAVSVDQPAKGDTRLNVTLPEVVGITVTYNGTDLEQVIDRELNIHTPIVDKQVKVSFKAVNDTTGEYKFREVTLTIPGLYAKEETDNPAPAVLPELQEWKGEEGTFAFTETSRVLYADDAFAYAAQALADDYAEMTGKTIAVLKGSAADAQAGDVVFAANSTNGLGEEGSLITIDEAITIEAQAETGAYWATRTILQAVSNSADASINKGIARDYPLYETRGLILDVGRKTFTMDYLKKLVKLMSWYKMNDFQVHLNDNYIPIEEYVAAGIDPFTNCYSGFRLESDIKAGGNNGLNQADLTSKDVFYTKDEFRSFIQESRAMGVNIVPEFDTPAHSLALTKVRPDLSMKDSNIRRPHDHLNLAGKYDECLEFVQSIFSEYISGEDPVFDAQTTLHIGADEYEASSVAYRKYVNDMIDYVETSGRKARVWGSFTQLSQGEKINAKGVEINIWNNGWANMDKMYEDGFDLINCVDGRYYIVPNATYYYDYLNDSTLYSGAINQPGDAKTYVPAGDAQMKGGAFAVWNDMCDNQENGMSEYDIYDRISKAAGLYAANAWGKGSNTTAQAKALASSMLANIPGADFGYSVASKSDVLAHLPLDDEKDLSGNGYNLKAGENAAIESVDYKKALRLNGGTSYALLEGLSTAGLNNDLRVKVKRTSDSKEEQILFESEYGSIKAVQKGTGKVGITRENRDYSFDYELPIGQWVELEIKNEFELVHLYVNGELVSTLGTHTRGQVKATCMLPIGIAGSKTKAFEGYVDDIRLNRTADFASTMKLDEKVQLASSLNTDGSLDAVIAAANAVIAKNAPTAQEINDAIAAIDAAMDGMEYAKADYSKIDKMLSLVPEDLSRFTADSVEALNRAVENITRNLAAAMQEAVDGMASTLSSALKGLTVRTSINVKMVDQQIMTATASSYQTASEPGYPSYAIDGDPTTMWHTDWNITTMPHWLAIEFDTPQTIDAVLYTPRSNGGNGTARSYGIEVSENGTTWTEIKSGTLTANAQVKTIELDEAVTTRHVRMVWKTATNNNGSCAEINFRKANAEADIAGLNAAIAKAEGLNAADYTEESWSALASVLAQAKTLAAAAAPDANETEVMIGNLCKAMAALDFVRTETPDPVHKADKLLLEEAVRYAETLSTEGVNELVVNRFNKALASARAVLADENADQQTVDEAWRELTSVIHMMNFTTDKSELEALVDECDRLDLGNYEDGPEKDAFIEALNHAKEVLANPAVLTEQSIQNAIDALTAAKAALTPKAGEEVDTTLLETVRQAAAKTEAELDKYVEAGKEEFLAAMRQAEAVLANPESQAQVDEMTGILHEAWLNLRLKADESVLKALAGFVEGAKQINRSLYEAEELKQIDAALLKIETALAAHESKTAEIDKNTGDDLLALSAEVQKIIDAKAGITPDAPAASTAPKTDAKTDNKTSQAKPDANSSSVKTAAAVSPAGWTAVFAAAGAALAGVIKRRKK